MISLIFFGALIVLAIGLAAKYFLDRKEHELRITWGEFGVASAILLLIVIPLTAWIGLKIAFQNSVTYHEFWGGYEVEAKWIVVKTSRDGAGAHKYDCDPYQVWVVDQPAYTDKDGNYHPEQGHYETRYHRCPYTTEEWTFVVRTTLGDYYIAENWLPTNPEQYRYRSPEGYSRRAPSHLPRGIPLFWQKAKERIDGNQPGPVTARRNYENYILASENTILKKYSQDIARYQKEGVLPALNASVEEFYFADRVYFVGVNPPPGDWQRMANYFNGAFGMDLQGDLHLVVVDANKINDPDNYIAALAAYWQSPAFGKDAFSKNGLLVVLGTADGQTVRWARAITGMPRGNERLLIDIRDQMPGTKLDPEVIFGPPRGELYQDQGKTYVRVVHSSGKLEQIVWGADKFERVRMRDYRYMIHEIEPTAGQKAWIYVAIVFFGCMAWGICIRVGTPYYRGYRDRRLR
ncbi:MAG TPA: hypothetical protein V6D17_05375 [Candidatus Obscuribacterales bacterium]